MSITGAILALEPIIKQTFPYKKADLTDISIAETIAKLKENNAEVLQIKVDENDFVSVGVIDSEWKNQKFYVNPKTGKKIAEIRSKNKFFSSIRNFHRSLFLKKTGRILIGISSFFLFLIAISGMTIVIKQGKGVKSFFSKTAKHSNSQYYHTIFGKWNLILIILISLSGVFLSLERFKVIKKQKIRHQLSFSEQPNQKKTFQDFEIFKETMLSSVEKIEFPFSDDKEDYFKLKLKNKELVVNQFNGEILSEVPKSAQLQLSEWVKIIHTAEGISWWAILLFISSAGILYFIYSGFDIALKRMKSKQKNKFTKNEATFIILVGSENGSTNTFGKILYKSLLKAGEKPFITSLNNYTSFKNAEHFVIMTSTYGDGEPPSNANKFIEKFQLQPTQNAHFSVIGFGSHAYEKFCQFAIDIQAALEQSKLLPAMPIKLIHNANFDSFLSWNTGFSRFIGQKLEIQPIRKEKKATFSFELIQKTIPSVASNMTFLMEFQIPKEIKGKSGDIIAIYPTNGQGERMYSAAITSKNTLLLSIKKHELGVCSSYLNELEVGDFIEGYWKKNPAFHFTKKTNKAIFISNGTGIAPFLGMLQQNQQKIETDLLWGGRTKDSFKIYNEIINDSLEKQHLSSLSIAYSQEKNLKKKYVQGLVKEQHSKIANCLNTGGEIFICGSVLMQTEVISELKTILESNSDKSFDQFYKMGKIKMDCY